MLGPDRRKRTAAITVVGLFLLTFVPSVYASHNHHYKFSSLRTYRSKLASTAVLHLTEVTQDGVTLLSDGYDRKKGIAPGNSLRPERDFNFNYYDWGSVVAGDIDRDGDVDLVWMGGYDLQDAVLWINEGDGNFEEVTDNNPYASELDGLFASHQSGKRSLKRKWKTSTLASPSFHDVELPVLTRWQRTTICHAKASGLASPIVQPHFVPYLHKRGPPLGLS